MNAYCFVSKGNVRRPGSTFARFRQIRGIEEESNGDRFTAVVDFIKRDWFLHSRSNADIARFIIRFITRRNGESVRPS